MADRKQGPLHVVAFPWLAMGHMIPFLELSQQVAKRGHLVSFVSAPSNIARLRPMIPAELSPRIRLVSLPLPAVDGLPEGAESTADVPPEKVELLKKAFDGLAAPFAAFLAGAIDAPAPARADWIVVDFAHHWAPRIADEHRVRCALFLIFPAAFVAFFGPKALNDAHPRTSAEDFTVPPPWWMTASTSLIPVAFKRHEAEWIVRSACRPNASGASDADRFWVTAERCPLILSRSSREVDGAFCDLLGDIYGKPVVPTGLLAPYAAAELAGVHHNHADKETASLVRWLDAQPERSVLYVAFGSEAPLTPSHVREVALGLELAGVRFLWALRKTRGGGGELLLQDVVGDDGFQAARAAGRGVVRVGWVPQVRVLAHAAVGAFMTHAGLSSLVESFLFGHPIVMLPLFADQGITARLMTERRVGLEVPRGDRDGSVRRDDVAATVRRVTGEEEFARNARALQNILWDTATQDRYLDDLIGQLLQDCNVQ